MFTSWCPQGWKVFEGWITKRMISTTVQVTINKDPALEQKKKTEQHGKTLLSQELLSY